MKLTIDNGQWILGNNNLPVRKDGEIVYSVDAAFPYFSGKPGPM